MKSRVRPSLCSRTVSTRVRSPGTKRSSPMRKSGPLAMSRMPVASTTRTPVWPSANLAYQSRTSGVTSPSSVARHGTMAGTHVRSAAVRLRPIRIGENQRDPAASSRVGQRAAGSGWRTRGPERLMSPVPAACLLGEARESVDLDETALRRIVEIADADERHRREVLAEVLAVDNADRLTQPLELRGVEHVDGQLHDIGELAVGGGDECLQVLADLPELGDQVALADHVTVAVLGDLAGEEERAAAAGLGGVGKALGLHEGGWVVERDLAGHRSLPIECRPARSFHRWSYRRRPAWPLPSPPQPARRAAARDSGVPSPRRPPRTIVPSGLRCCAHSPT